MTTGCVTRTRLPGLQVAEIKMEAGDFIPLHDHPCSSIYMYVVSGHVEMCVFEVVEKNDQSVRLKLQKKCVMKAGQTCSIAMGEASFHTVKSITDSHVVDCFSLEDCEGCVSIFYDADAEDLEAGEFTAQPMPRGTADLPIYFKEDYVKDGHASDCS